MPTANVVISRPDTASKKRALELSKAEDAGSDAKKKICLTLYGAPSLCFQMAALADFI